MDSSSAEGHNTCLNPPVKEIVPTGPGPPQCHTAELQVCQLAQASVRSRKLIKLHGVLCDRPVVCLVDSGASGNFISATFVQQCSNNVQANTILAEQQVRLADGTVLSATRMLPQAHLVINSYSDNLDLVCLPLGGFDVILGMPWLEHVNPYIDWCNKTLTFHHDQLQHTLQTDMSLCLQLQTAQELRRSIGRRQVEEVFLIRCHDTQLEDKHSHESSESCNSMDQSSSRATTDESACNHHRRDILDRFRSVFPSDLPKGLPPAREIDQYHGSE
jgi:hypothetical protein